MSVGGMRVGAAFDRSGRQQAGVDRRPRREQGEVQQHEGDGAREAADQVADAVGERANALLVSL